MKHTWLLGLTGVVGAGLLVWRGRKAAGQQARQVPPAQARNLLERAAPLLRLPTAPDQQPEVLADGGGLRCPVTGRVYPYQAGVLYLLVEATPLTLTQHSLDTPLTAWAYDRFRDMLLAALGLPDFRTEVATIGQALELHRGDIVLDLACGHGNFTVEWARQVGSEGLVIGLDLSPAMLARAGRRVQTVQATNVLLVRGDALHLPLVDGTLSRVNCSGGFHQLPDLPQALREIARVSAAGAILTASTFAEAPSDARHTLKQWCHARLALHFVPLAWLGEQLAAVGFGGYQWSLPGGWFGYTSARKEAATRQ